MSDGNSLSNSKKASQNQIYRSIKINYSYMGKSNIDYHTDYRGVQGNLPDNDIPFVGSFAKVFPKGEGLQTDSIAFGTVTRIRNLVNGDVSYKLSGIKGGTFRMSEYDIILYSLENPEVRKKYGFKTTKDLQ